MKLDREEFLQKLESCTPAVDKKATIEQSDCFIFQGGKIIAFNDEIAASCESPLNGVEGAVKAEPLAQILRKLTDDKIDIEVKDGELLVKTKSKKRAGIAMEADVVLAVDSIEEAEEWKPLPEDFCEGIQVVQNCASKDESHFALTCVHITSEFVEACDNTQVTRYPVKLGLNESCLIRRDSIKHVAQLGVNEFSEGVNWLHLRNSQGVQLSCRRYAEDFPDLSGILDQEGSKTVLPGGLAEACDKASVFSSDTPDDNQVEVSLKDGTLKLRGQGAHGWYEERSKVTYTGPALQFLIDPKLLTELVKRTSECEIGDGKLIIDGGSFRYVACLG